VQGSLELSSAQTHQFRLRLPSPITLTLDLLYFPGWQATVDGAPIATNPHPGNGLIDVRLPAGEHTLLLHFGETTLRTLADILSISAWLGLVLFITLRVVRKVLHRKGSPGGDATIPLGGTQRFPWWGRNDNWVETGVNQGWQWMATLSMCISLLIAVYFLLPDWFQLHSQADEALPAVTQRHVDFGDKLRLLGVDPPPAMAVPGASVTVVTYWRALQRLPNNYAIFLHLDAPNGQTIATVDQTHPSNIPTSSWAPSLYVRVPLRLIIPANALPIRYRLRVGIVDQQNEAWLSFIDRQKDAVPQKDILHQEDVLTIGELWVEPPTSRHVATGLRGRFGTTIQLLSIDYDRITQAITLDWQTDTPIPKDYIIFVHALDASGAMLGQIDTAPYQNQYPTSAWRPTQVITDRRVLASIVEHPEQISRFAIGLYDPTSGERLPATDETGKPLADNALIINVASLK
jgi:hypothetical protein